PPRRPVPSPTPFPYTTLFRSLAHGVEGTGLGYVVALTITDLREGTRFVHASDVQGPLSAVAAAYLIREKPDILYLSGAPAYLEQDRKSTRLNSSHLGISYAVF